MRISWRRDRLPFGLGARTHAFSSFLPISNAAHRSCNSSIKSLLETQQLRTLRVRPEEPQGPKESGPRAYRNNRQFLSVAPNAILTDELRASQ